MFSSKGLKRLIASALISVAAALVATGNPAALVLAAKINAVAASLGVVGLVHAGVSPSGSFRRYVLSSIAALLAAAQYLPFLTPWVSLLQEAATLLSAAAVGQAWGETKKNR